jgi:hypothetical protein
VRLRSLLTALATTALLIACSSAVATAARCRSSGTAVNITVNRPIFCGAVAGSTVQFISTYAVLKPKFFQQWDGGGEFFDWNCSVNSIDPRLYRVRCASTKFAVFRTSLHGRIAASFDWRTGPLLDAKRCGSFSFGNGYTLLSGSLNPGESCLDLNSFFKQVQQSRDRGYPPTPPGWNPDVENDFSATYTFRIGYTANVLMRCRLGRSIVLCRPDNGDLAPTGRYTCVEHFTARTRPSSGVTAITDQWRCTRTQFASGELSRVEDLRWRDDLTDSSEPGW